jgi:hypothetical protein
MFIRSVTKEERDAILSDVKPDEFTLHEHQTEWYRKTGALRDGASVFFNPGDEKHPKINAFIDAFANGRKRGVRTYLYRMSPGQEIYEHADTGVPYFDSLIDRYQVFFDIPEGLKVYHVFQPQPNSIIWFDHKKTHSYKNDSNEFIYFMVIDLFK